MQRPFGLFIIVTFFLATSAFAGTDSVVSNEVLPLKISENASHDKKHEACEECLKQDKICKACRHKHGWMEHKDRLRHEGEEHQYQNMESN